MSDNKPIGPPTTPAVAMQSAFVAACRESAQRHRRPLLGAVAAVAVTAAAAWALPVEVADGRAAAVRNPLAAPPPQLAPEEDLAAFLASRRWGMSLAEADATRAAEEAAQLEQAARAELDRIGFVGVSATVRPSAGTSAGRAPDDWAERVVLLALPEGGIARFAVGDTLPDGRRLVAITAAALTLAADGEQETLRLFPALNDGQLGQGDGWSGGESS